MNGLPPGVRVVGIPWFPADAYNALLAIMVDRDKLHSRHGDCLRAAEQAEKQCQRSGLTVVRVDLDLDAFPAFCRARGLKVDAEGRSAYASAGAAGLLQDQAGRQE